MQDPSLILLILLVKRDFNRNSGIDRYFQSSAVPLENSIPVDIGRVEHRTLRIKSKKYWKVTWTNHLTQCINIQLVSETHVNLLI